MLDRDRRLVRRVRNLRDEAAVLAERFGQTLAHAGGAAVQNILQDAFVSGNPVGRRRCDFRDHDSVPRYWAIATLTKARAAGATDSVRSPWSSKAGICLGSLPRSPQRLTSRPVDRARSTTVLTRRSRAREGRASSASSGSSRLAAARYWRRSLLP